MRVTAHGEKDTQTKREKAALNKLPCRVRCDGDITRWLISDVMPSLNDALVSGNVLCVMS